MNAQRRRRTVLGLLVVLVTALVAAALSPAVARAAAAPTVVLSPSGGPVGSSVTARGTGFTPGETVDLRYDDGEYVRASGPAGTRGEVTLTFTVPFSDPGAHQVWLTGRAGGRTAGAAFAVRESWTQVGGGAAHRSAAVHTPDLGDLRVFRRELGDPVAAGSGPVVDAGVVYAVTARGTVHAITRTGATKWTGRAGGDVVGSPAVAGDRVVVVRRDGVVVGLDVLTGVTRWTAALGSSAGVGPAVDRGRAFVGLGDGRLVALDVTTGAPTWTAPGSGAVTTVPTVAANTVVVARGTAVASVQLTTGAARWATTVAGGAVQGTLAYSATYNRVMAVSGGVGLVGFDASSGATRWTLPGVVSPFAVTVLGGLVYAERTATRGVTVEAVGADDGRVLRSPRFVTAPSTGGMTYTGNGVGGLLFSTSADGTLRAVDQGAGDRSLVWSTPVGVTTAPVAAVDGTLYVLTTDGVLTRFSS